MNVQHVVEFIATLRNEKKDKKEYLEFLGVLSKHFDGKNLDSVITEDDVRFLHATLGTRWYNATEDLFHYTCFVEEWRLLIETLPTKLDLSINQFLMPALLVEHIFTFLTQLSSKKKYFASCDEVLLQDIFNHFSGKNANVKLTLNDYEFLKNIYKQRWDIIRKSDQDYTHNATEVNHHWIALAKKLESSEFDSNKPSLEKFPGYLYILMPTINHRFDLNDYSDPLLIIDLRNLFLSSDGKNLYKKLSMVTYMLGQNRLFALQTKDGRHLYSIEDLHRLKTFSPKITVTIPRIVFSPNDPFINRNNNKEQEFEGFWGFLDSVIFPYLTTAVVPEAPNERGRMPYHLLSALVELIKTYYQLKKQKSECFQDFKIKLNEFFTLLESDNYSLLDVNFLYGQKIFCKGKSQYILDIFVTLYSAKNLEIDAEMKALGEFLFKVYPIFKSMRFELGEDNLDHSVSESEHIINVTREDAFSRSCSILVSLYATSFGSNNNRTFFSSGLKEISDYDQKNYIPEELSEHYTALKSMLSTKKELYRDAYSEFMTNISMKILKGAKTNWIHAVQQMRLTDIGGFWLAPEAIFSVLKNSNFDGALLIECSNLLDEIIRTKTQNPKYVSDFHKKFRVNVLFSKFVSHQLIPDEFKMSLIAQIMDYSTSLNTPKFHIDADNYLYNRLNALSDLKVPEYAPFSAIVSRHSDEPIYDVIEHYLHHTKGLAKDLLIKLRDPILAISNHNERRSDQNISAFEPS